MDGEYVMTLVTIFLSDVCVHAYILSVWQWERFNQVICSYVLGVNRIGN